MVANKRSTKGVSEPRPVDRVLAFLEILLRRAPAKGNINRKGERIYHTPGQQAYSVTRINPTAGERWFCSEAEASAAGWRKALQ